MSLDFIFPSDQEIEGYFPLMKELREELTPQKFINIYLCAKAEGYKLMGVTENNNLVGLMGYRIITDYVHGRHLYIDDLVTTKKVRSQGLGAKILQKAEEIARNEECEGLRLCTGIQNERGKKFYEQNGWNLRAVAFKKKL